MRSLPLFQKVTQGRTYSSDQVVPCSLYPMKLPLCCEHRWHVEEVAPCTLPSEFFFFCRSNFRLTNMLRPSGNKALISMRALVLPLGVLTMFAILIVTYVMTSGTSTATIPRLSCINPVILTGSFQDKTLPARAWVLVQVHLLLHQFHNSQQAHVHQRHMDRWLYPHPLIGNLCWEDQLNSTHAPMPDQCTYDLSSVWEDFNHT